MPPLARRLAVLAALALAYACASGPQSNDGVCDPPCSAGKVCHDGACVRADGGSSGNPGDGGGIIIPTGRDAGQAQRRGDSGMDECTGTTSTGQLLPLDMYVMLDQSVSMGYAVAGGTRWSAVTAALKSFLQENVNAAGMSVGIQYYALPGNGQCDAFYDTYCNADADCGPCGPCKVDTQTCEAAYWDESCNPADYAQADVEIASLTQVQVTTISGSIDSHSPTSDTPTSAALQGAINHARTWSRAHPQHVVIVILATDGEPNECDVSTASIQAIAAAGVGGSPRVLTFVIGVGTQLTLLNGIASSGGTGAAFLVDIGGDVNTQFLAALNRIRGTVVGCNYLIPPPPAGRTLDFAQVNVQYTPGSGGAMETLIYVDSQGACAGASRDAWYYDNPAAPTQIILCDSACARIKADTNAQVDIQLGCGTSIN